MIFCSHKVFYFFCIEQTTITFYHEKIVCLRRLFIFFFFIAFAIIRTAESNCRKKNDRTKAPFSETG